MGNLGNALGSLTPGLLYQELRDTLEAIAPICQQAWDGVLDTTLVDYEKVYYKSRQLTMVGQAGNAAPTSCGAFLMPSRRERVGSDTGEYSYLAHKTTQWMWDTCLTPKSVATTLGSSTRYDTETKTIYIPETGERVFESVMLVVWFRTENTSSASPTAWRLGIQLGAAATSDQDFTTPAIATITHNSVYTVKRDVTDYFNANFGSGLSQTAVASLAVQANTATAVNGMVFQLLVTYAFDPNATNTRIKTIRIPIQSQSTTLTNVQQEVGTDGVSPAPTGQIPALDTFLPESSKVYRQICLDLYGNDGSLATFTPIIQIDSNAEVNRATVDVTQAVLHPWRDQYDMTSFLTTNATHVFNMRCDASGHLVTPGGFVVVTYEYDHAATVIVGTAIYEAIVPLTQSDDDGLVVAAYDTLNSAANLAQNAQRQVAILDIQEPGTVTMVQSGILCIEQVSTSTGVFQKKANQQPPRVSSPIASIGCMYVTHRVDINGGWSLQRGSNRLPIDLYAGVGRTTSLGGVCVLNYTAGIRSDIDRGNHAVVYSGPAPQPIASLGVDVNRGDAGIRPVQLGLPFKISGAHVEAYVGASTAFGAPFVVEQLPGEYDMGFTWVYNQTSQVAGCMVETMYPFTHSINLDNYHTGKLDITQRRRQVLQQNSVSITAHWHWWVTYHQHAYVVAGNVSINGQPAADGKTVEIYAKDSNGNGDLVNIATIAGGAGHFSATVPDNTRSYFASYTDGIIVGKSQLSTPA